jgi:hypothetical protein
MGICALMGELQVGLEIGAIGLWRCLDTAVG